MFTLSPPLPLAGGLQKLGLNLADNGVTDRGAALLSVCLQHNATLCALVLDGNSDIGRDAERRITEELETRSVMPEVRQERVPLVVVGVVEILLDTEAAWKQGLNRL